MDVAATKPRWVPMSWQKLFDAYDWKARWFPTAIVLLPLFLTTYYCFPGLLNSPVLVAGSGVVSVALVYLASMVLRELGRRVEPQVWAAWGGPPSTRFARHIDTHFNEDHKRRIRLSLRRRFGIELPDADKEARNLLATDRTIEQGFRGVREFLRQRDRVALVDKHNAEYGFARNLYAGRWVALGLALVGALAAGFTRPTDGLWTMNGGVITGLLYAVLWFPFAWFFLPALLKRTADTYAERAWMTFLEIEENQ